jgi:hypothetical protein
MCAIPGSKAAHSGPTSGGRGVGIGVSKILVEDRTEMNLPATDLVDLHLC